MVPAVIAKALASEDVREALANRDLAAVYRVHSRYGTSQRQVAVVAAQSQSEISETLAGRPVVAYDVLVRVAEGLGVPWGFMGLAYCMEATYTTPGASRVIEAVGPVASLVDTEDRAANEEHSPKDCRVSSS